MNENPIINETLLNENADFLKAAVGAKTIEEAKNICTEYNIELPQDVWEKIQAAYCDGKQNSDELAEDDLNAISGGMSGKSLLSTVGQVVVAGTAITSGTAAGVLLACAWVGYYAYKTFS